MIQRMQRLWERVILVFKDLCTDTYLTDVDSSDSVFDLTRFFLRNTDCTDVIRHRIISFVSVL